MRGEVSNTPSVPERGFMAHFVLGLVVGWISGAAFVVTLWIGDGGLS